MVFWEEVHSLLSLIIENQLNLIGLRVLFKMKEVTQF